MNQQKIPQQRSPRSQTQRYVGRPIRLPKKCALPKVLLIATILTGVLLVISLMILSIALLVGPTERPEGEGDKTDRTEQTPPVTTNSTIPVRLQLPSATSQGVYLSTEDGVAI